MEDLQPLIDDGFCSKEEAEAIASKPEPFVPILSMVVCIAQDLRDTHYLTDMQIHLISTLIVDFRAQCANVLLFVNTQLPYLAVQLFAVIVYAYLLQLLAVSGGVVGLGLETGDYSSVFMGYFTVLLSSYIYFGLLSLYSILANPFGDDACDFPVASYQVGGIPSAARLGPSYSDHSLIECAFTSARISLTESPNAAKLSGRLGARMQPSQHWMSSRRHILRNCCDCIRMRTLSWIAQLVMKKIAM